MRFGRSSNVTRMLVVEITPMIDVVFLLIIFFMTTARFARETRADLELPPEVGEQQETGEEAGLVINIDANGTIIVGAEELTIETLEELVIGRVNELRGRDPTQLKLMIRADRRLDTARLNAVVARLQRLGIGAARVATQP